MRAIIVLKVKLHVIKITVFCLWDWMGKGAYGWMGKAHMDAWACLWMMGRGMYYAPDYVPVTNHIWRIITPDAHPHAKKQPETIPCFLISSFPRSIDILRAMHSVSFWTPR
jgi:hypothetical protein